MKKTIIILIMFIAAFQVSSQVVEINKPDSLNINSWGNVEVTNEDLYHVQLTTTRSKAAIIISNQVTARQTNVLTLPDQDIVINYIDNVYSLHYSDSLYQWNRVTDCRAFVKKIIYLH